MLLVTTAEILFWLLMEEKLVIGAIGTTKNTKLKNRMKTSYHAAAEVQLASYCK